jgi:quinol monooxygenase YgiN
MRSAADRTPVGRAARTEAQEAIVIFIVDDFTKGTRSEPGNIFFEWSRSVDNPNEFVLVEAFRDGDAGGAHVNSDHFKAAMGWMPDVVAATPQIINVEVPGDGWSLMAEVTPR